MPIEEAPGGKFAGALERGEMYAEIQKKALDVLDSMTDLSVPQRGELKEKVVKAVEKSIAAGGINTLHTDIMNSVGNEEFNRRFKAALEM